MSCIQVNKFYRTRNNQKVRIICNDAPGQYSLIGFIMASTKPNESLYTICQWLSDGFAVAHHHPNELDIMEPWVDLLEFDWTCLPPWLRSYVAMDKNGKWFAYDFKPDMDISVWRNPAGPQLEIPVSFAPKNFYGAWNYSLRRNPNK